MGVSDNEETSDDVCESCGTTVAQGKTGCRGLFEEILAREFSDYRYGKIHRLTVDSYALQHPDEYMRSGKSFVAHLTGMCAALEYADALTINQIVQRWLSTNPEIAKPLHLPKKRENLTIAYIHSASDADEHTKRVREWARDVWGTWSEHHELARHFINDATVEINNR